MVVGWKAYNTAKRYPLADMKTDPSIYAYLATDPEAFRVLSGGLRLTGPYAFRALTLKGIERRLDGLYEPEGHEGRCTWSNSRRNRPPAPGTTC